MNFWGENEAKGLSKKLPFYNHLLKNHVMNALKT